MKQSHKAFLIALVITLTVAGYALSTAKSTQTGEVQGVTATPSSIRFENQAERLPQSKISTNTLLVTLGRSVGLNIVELVDATFPWKSEVNTYEIIGKSVEIRSAGENTKTTIVSELKKAGFVANEINTYEEDNKINTGFNLEDDVCLIKEAEIKDSSTTPETISKKVSVYCGLIDYSRVLE